MKGRAAAPELGTWFAVPLPKGGYGLCLLARRQKRRGFSKIFVYVFGPRLNSIDDLQMPVERRPDERVGFTFTFDDCIRNGRWPVIGSTNDFLQDEWPLPPTKRGPIGGGPDYTRRFNLYGISSDLVRGPALGEHLLDNISDYPNDETHGYVAFEEYAERMIAGVPFDMDR